MWKNTEVIFIRHGETDFNKAKLYFGHSDPDLNATGMEQLRNTRILLEKREKTPDIVFSSDLKRCSQSMEILGIDKRVEKILTEELREVNFGIFEGKTYEEIKNEYPDKVEKMRNDWRNFKVDKGESINEMMLRTAKKMDEIIKIETKNGMNAVSSRVIAEELGKYHKDVLESITKIILNNSAEISAQYILSSYKDKSGKYSLLDLPLLSL